MPHGRDDEPESVEVEAEASEVEKADERKGAADKRGEKPWYRQQHEAAARARSGGTLLERRALPGSEGGDTQMAL